MSRRIVRRSGTTERPILRFEGAASREDADALREEGIEVMALPLPDAVKGPVQ